MVAMGDYFEIWNAATYDEVEAAETAEWLEDQPEDFDPLSLIDPPGDGG
jgi:MraZ protein